MIIRGHLVYVHFTRLKRNITLSKSQGSRKTQILTQRVSRKALQWSRDIIKKELWLDRNKKETKLDHNYLRARVLIRHTHSNSTIWPPKMKWRKNACNVQTRWRQWINKIKFKQCYQLRLSSPTYTHSRFICYKPQVDIQENSATLRLRST